MYVTNLISYNAQVFCNKASAPFIGIIERVRELYHTKIRGMDTQDYRLKLVAAILANEEDSRSTRLGLTAYQSARYLLLKIHTSEVALALVGNFSIFGRPDYFSVNGNVVSGRLMLSTVQTLDDLIEILVFIEYCTRSQIEAAVAADDYANRKQLSIIEYTKHIENAS